ncbi:protein NRT1/ PTR FAMILY 8.3-like [Asparagus officinalis]|uniref:protein NRT1/ PTR FAMILY 8.3-like n=1 Tax=Asparagus officinalis TaxID=4686 RepID=UPI00098E3068|nr:protein NRT1/ PTR FAMILY 8.3-like [Asparagus officinalis]
MGIPIQGQDFLLERALLQRKNSELYTGDGSVDIQGKPVLRSKTGKWRASSFILGTECCERVTYFGIVTNLVSYITSILHKGNVSAARSVSTWNGTCYLTPLVGAFLADAYWGKYRTIAVFSSIYFIGMCTLTISASIPAFRPPQCLGLTCPSATPAQSAIFFVGLYLIAVGMGGIKPCISSFGADQFDDTDPRERVAKGSFFNWFFFFMYIGALLSSSLIVWIQENVGWAVGFGIPALFMGLAVASFFSGTRLYRFRLPGGSPVTRISQVVVASLRKWKFVVPQDSSLLYETSDEHSAIEGSRKLGHTDGLKSVTILYLLGYLSDSEMNSCDFSSPWRLCTVTQVEESKILIRMFPIWATSIFFCVVYSQLSTTFVEQAKVMDRTVGSFTIPAASLSVLYVMSGMVGVLAYDKIVVPMIRNFTGRERGFSELQRIGIGLFISCLAMVAGALVESRRLQLAKELDLVDKNVVVPLKFYWQIPQYFLVGCTDVFSFVGAMEFFYNQSPDAIRSLCVALPLLLTSVGSYLNSLILTIVAAITTAGGKAGWIPDNMNQGHLDYFFWLLSGLSFLNLLMYGFCSMKYKPKKVL